MQKIKIWSKFWLETMGEKTSSPLISFCFDKIKNSTKGKPSKNKNVFLGKSFQNMGWWGGWFLPFFYQNFTFRVPKSIKNPGVGGFTDLGEPSKKTSLFGWLPKLRSRNGFDYFQGLKDFNVNFKDVKDVNDYKWCKRKGFEGYSLQKCYGTRKCKRTQFKNAPGWCDVQLVAETISDPFIYTTKKLVNAIKNLCFSGASTVQTRRGDIKI